MLWVDTRPRSPPAADPLKFGAGPGRASLFADWIAGAPPRPSPGEFDVTHPRHRDHDYMPRGFGAGSESVHYDHRLVVFLRRAGSYIHLKTSFLPLLGPSRGTYMYVPDVAHSSAQPNIERPPNQLDLPPRRLPHALPILIFASSTWTLPFPSSSLTKCSLLPEHPSNSIFLHPILYRVSDHALPTGNTRL